MAAKYNHFIARGNLSSKRITPVLYLATPGNYNSQKKNSLLGIQYNFKNPTSGGFIDNTGAILFYLMAKHLTI